MTAYPAAYSTHANGQRIGKSVIEMAEKNPFTFTYIYADLMAKSLTEKIKHFPTPKFPHKFHATDGGRECDMRCCWRCCCVLF